MEQEIPQTVGHQLVVMETMLLNHVRMRSNDDLHAKGHKMFCRTKLVGKSSSIMFMSEVDENYNDVDFSLSTIKKQQRLAFLLKGAMRKCILEQRNLFCTWKDLGSRQREKIYIYI